jgi:CRISPR/Cas system CMR subunit Cmr4 (Cas7 group RAMP superfamily)
MRKEHYLLKVLTPLHIGAGQGHACQSDGG